MAPGSVTSDISPSSTSTAGSSKSTESEKPGPSHSSFPVGRRHPPVLRMVLEALQAGEQRRGTSVAAIKLYILHKYPTVDVLRFKYLLKQALATGMRRGLLTRPLNSKARGATGSFKLVPKHKRKIQPRKMAPPTAPRRVGEAKGKGPKKPSEAKEDPPNVDKVKKAPPKPGAATEKARKQGGAAKDTRPQPGEARKVPPKPDKAIQEPSSAGGLSRKAKAKGSRSSQGDAEACRKTTTGSKSSKPTASKVKNGAASPTKKKVVAKAKAKAKAPKAGQGPNTKAVAPAKGSGSKVVPAHLSRKTEAPKGPRKAGLPIKASSSKVSSQRAEA
ncbi:histone H1.8 [Macaca fascicularis]|uniref:histone H1.8 n=1 Tax=Macaca fascicularis TaxID=9541 RepID=UPI0032B05955